MKRKVYKNSRRTVPLTPQLSCIVDNRSHRRGFSYAALREAVLHIQLVHSGRCTNSQEVFPAGQTKWPQFSTSYPPPPHPVIWIAGIFGSSGCPPSSPSHGNSVHYRMNRNDLQRSFASFVLQRSFILVSELQNR